MFWSKELEDAALGPQGMVGWYDYGARMYNPRLGRWLAQDPARQVANPYLFCGNAPTNYVDPDGKFFLSFLFGFVEGLFTGENPFKTGWHDVKMSVKLVGGLFTGNFLQILSRLTWELPQTLLGLGAGVGANWFNTVDNVEYAYGATVTRMRGGPDWGAFTLGSYMLGDKNIEANPSNYLFQHEYGHYLQSRAFGWSYLGKVGIPSLVSAGSGGNHSESETEQDANARALTFWEGKAPGFYMSEWDKKNNDIIDFDWNKPFDDPINQHALNNAYMDNKRHMDISVGDSDRNIWICVY